MFRIFGLIFGFRRYSGFMELGRYFYLGLEPTKAQGLPFALHPNPPDPAMWIQDVLSAQQDMPNFRATGPTVSQIYQLYKKFLRLD